MTPKGGVTPRADHLNRPRPFQDCHKCGGRHFGDGDVNKFMRGEMGDARIWCVSRVVPLAKKQSLAPRPICVLDSWLRLVARIAARHFAGEAAMAPARSSVSEYEVHTSAFFANLFQNRHDCVIDTVDVTNAFN